tara:strand:- start:621 stop:1031 length:411 start_codon:yes stop_codon:yes gene_type:complete
MNYTNVTNPKWTSAEHTTIDCEVTFDEIGTVPFTATPNDTEEHGRDIYVKAIAGEFGVIAEWTPPTTEQLASNARGQRDALLAELDSIVGNPLRWASFSSEQQTSWANYRQALLDVPQQAGFPNTINWPTKLEETA